MKQDKLDSKSDFPAAENPTITALLLNFNRNQAETLSIKKRKSIIFSKIKYLSKHLGLTLAQTEDLIYAYAKHAFYLEKEFHSRSWIEKLNRLFSGEELSPSFLHRILEDLQLVSMEMADEIELEAFQGIGITDDDLEG